MVKWKLKKTAEQYAGKGGDAETCGKMRSKKSNDLNTSCCIVCVFSIKQHPVTWILVPRPKHTLLLVFVHLESSSNPKSLYFPKKIYCLQQGTLNRG